VPMDEDQKPLDPVTENQNIITMKPVKAFLYQDHQAHIMVHMSAMQDPKIQQLMQQNPGAQAMMQSMMAHINEHTAFEYRRQIEQQLGMPLPPEKDEEGEDNHLIPEVEARLSPLLAQAAQRLLMQNQQEAAQKQAQQQAQDPLIQMQMQELQIKQQEQQRKAQKDQMDMQARAQQLQIEQQRIQAQAATDAQRMQLDAMKMAAEIQAEKERAQLGAMKMSAELTAKTIADNNREKADMLKAAALGAREREKLMAQLSMDVMKEINSKKADKSKPQKGD